MARHPTLTDHQAALVLEAITKRLCTMSEAAEVVGISRANLNAHMRRLRPDWLPNGRRAPRAGRAKRLAAFLAFWTEGLLEDNIPYRTAERWSDGPIKRRLPSRGTRTKAARAAKMRQEEAL